MCYRFWEQVTVPRRKCRNKINLRELVVSGMIFVGILATVGGIAMLGNAIINFPDVFANLK